MNVPGKKVRRTRLIRTDRYVVAVEVDAVLLSDGEAVFLPDTVRLLRDVEAHAKAGDLAWLREHGKVYAAVEAA